MSKGLNQIESMEERIATAKRRIKEGGKNPGLAALGAKDWERNGFKTRKKAKAS